MLSEQPAHNALFMGKRLSAGMLIAEAALSEKLCGLYVQYDQLVNLFFRQSLRGVQLAQRMIGDNEGFGAVIAVLRADGEVDGRARLRQYIQIAVPLRAGGEVRREQLRLRAITSEPVSPPPDMPCR